MSRYNYSPINDFGSNVAPQNPLDVCLNDTIDNKFQGGVLGDLYGQHSDKCQMLLSQYCGNKWDNFCELASKNTSRKYPNLVQSCIQPSLTACENLTAGENLIRNSAYERFCKTPSCAKKCEPFNPMDPNSPMVCYTVNACSYSDDCPVVCRIDNVDTIDQDPLMYKILTNPHACMDVLVNIYKTAKREGTLSKLKKTNVGKLFDLYPNIFN